MTLKFNKSAIDEKLAGGDLEFYKQALWMVAAGYVGVGLDDNGRMLIWFTEKGQEVANEIGAENGQPTAP